MDERDDVKSAAGEVARISRTPAVALRRRIGETISSPSNARVNRGGISPAPAIRPVAPALSRTVVSPPDGNRAA